MGVNSNARSVVLSQNGSRCGDRSAGRFGPSASVRNAMTAIFSGHIDRSNQCDSRYALRTDAPNHFYDSSGTETARTEMTGS